MLLSMLSFTKTNLTEQFWRHTKGADRYWRREVIFINKQICTYFSAVNRIKQLENTDYKLPKKLP